MTLTLSYKSRFLLKKHPLILATCISFLIHLLFCLSLIHFQQISILPIFQKDNNHTYQPLVFEIVNSYEQSQNPPDQASLYSDKNAIAKDLNNHKLNSDSRPYSEGFVETKEISSLQEYHSQGETNLNTKTGNRQNLYKNQQLTYSHPTTQKKFDRSHLIDDRSTAPSKRNSPQYNQINSSVEDFGSIQFNTYAWDFAPYLLELKKRIQNHIFPPPVFTQLGFGGKNVLRFRITPDGKLEGPNILAYHGEKSLIETSLKAVEVSAPFDKLPENFPEDYLEVTATFEYLGIR